MRMWNVNPALMCRKHLLGEHVELHMFKGSIQKGKRLDGYIAKKLLNIGKIKKRHDELVIEMEKRGYKHNSPMDYFNETAVQCNGLTFVDETQNKIELANRCLNCRKLQNGN